MAKKNAATTQPIDPARLVLSLNPPTPPDLTLFAGFLDALCGDREYQKRAIRAAVGYLLGGYADLKQLAAENYAANPYLQQLYPSEADFLITLHLPNKLYATLDLATGTGKSYVLFGIAQIMLTLGAVDNALILCPSLTIKEGLTQKFEALAYHTPALYSALQVAAPDIIDAADTLDANTICVTNIHQTYAGVKSAIEPVLTRTGGQRTLVLNDEVHHIVTAPGQKANEDSKEWMKFLDNPERSKDYGFRYIIGVSGTPYTGKDNEHADIYFSDVIYRYSLVEATRDGYVKDIYYRVEGRNDDSEEARWAIMMANHRRNRDRYLGLKIKPLTIIVTRDIKTCNDVHGTLLQLLLDHKLAKDIDEAKQIAIPVTSSPEHRDYVAQLAQVDNFDNPVQWIVSVSMLTEGWDVKNVFQIVPHESRAFNSKLLIAQVIGRGLRLPELPPPLELKTEDARLIIFNHPSIAKNMSELGRVAELQRISELVSEVSGGTAQKLTPQVVNQPPRDRYHFSLHNLSYDIAASSTMMKASTTAPAAITDLGFRRQPAGDIAVTGFGPLAHSGAVMSSGATFVPRLALGYTIAQTIAAYYADLQNIAREVREAGQSAAAIEEYPLERIAQLVRDGLSDEDRARDYVSEDNYERGRTTLSRLRPPAATPQTRYTMQPTTVETRSTADLRYKASSVLQFWKDNTLFYTRISRSLMHDPDSLTAFDFLKQQENSNPHPHLKQVEGETFLSPVDLVVSGSDPEFQMLRRLFDDDNVELPDCLKAWVKSADTGFYTIPYTLNGKKREFNPDFILKLELDGREVVLIIEIKSDKDDSEENRAKQRAATRHFAELNRLLEAGAVADRQPRPHYIFFFLSPTDYGNLFATLQKCSLEQLEQYRGTLAATLAAAPPTTP